MSSIKQNQVLDNSVQKAFVDLNEAITITLKQLDLLLKDGKEIQSTFGNATGIKSYTEALQKLEKNRKEANTLTKQQIDLLKKEESLKQSVARTTSAQEKAIQSKNRTAEQERKISERQAKQAAKLTSVYARQSKTLTLLRNRAKNLALTYGTTSKQFLQAEKRVVALDSKMKKLDSRLGQSQRFVGKYEKALGGLKNILGAAGVVGGFQLLFTTLKDGIKISKEYEKSNAVLASVLGKQISETKELQGESKRLGSTTAFTASQVTELQTELARLGKSEAEIIASTEGIINATIALGSETGETAALVGATLNAFQLEAKESGRVADILTLATQKSALSFDKLNTALPTVSGAASAAGVSLETMVAQLGQAADRGLDASTAATSLRNIYITLAEKGITLDEALTSINKSQNKLNTATTIFGKRASVTALALASTRDKTNELDLALQNAGGTAENVAKTQLDTLDGQMKILNSKWEGLILNVFNSDGAFGEFSETVLILATALIGLANSLFDNSKALTEVQVGIENVVSLYETEEELLEDVNVLREQLIKSLEEEGLGYKEAKKEADKYIKTLQFFADKTNLLSLELGTLKVKREQLLAVGLSTFEIDQKILNVQDKLKFATVELTESTIDELNAFKDKYESYLLLNDAQQEFLDNVIKEIASRDKVVEAVGEETEVVTDLIKKQEELLAIAKELPGSTKAEILFRKAKVEAIEEEIKMLKALGEEKKLEFKTKDVSVDIDKVSEKELEKLQAKVDKEVSIIEEGEKRKAESKKQWTEFGFDQVQNLASTAFDIAGMQRDQETEAEILALQDRLNNEKLDEEQRELLAKQIAVKEAKIRTDKAKADKKAAIIQSIINTALSIGKTAATVGFPAAIPFIAIAAATGLVQLAAIQAQPIPKFDKGSESLPDGLKEVAERRPEFVKSKKGVELFKKPTVLGDDYTGAEVISGVKTAEILENVSRQEINHNILNSSNPTQDAMFADAINKAFEQHSGRMVKAINRNRPVKEKSSYRELEIRRNLRNQN